MIRAGQLPGCRRHPAARTPEKGHGCFPTDPATMALGGSRPSPAPPPLSRDAGNTWRRAPSALPASPASAPCAPFFGGTDADRVNRVPTKPTVTCPLHQARRTRTQSARVFVGIKSPPCIPEGCTGPAPRAAPWAVHGGRRRPRIADFGRRRVPRPDLAFGTESATSRLGEVAPRGWCVSPIQFETTHPSSPITSPSSP